MCCIFTIYGYSNTVADLTIFNKDICVATLDTARTHHQKTDSKETGG